MNVLLPFLFAANLISVPQIPAGTELHIRLMTAVGSYASRVGSPVQAVLIAPVIVDGETLVRAGTIVSGEVKSVKRVGLGVMHETAALGLDFTCLTPDDGDVVPICSRVERVDNGRERVGRDGVIHAARSTGSICYRASGYIRTALQWEVESAVAVWFIKTLVISVPEPEIYYRAGSELTLTLKQPLLVKPESGHDVAGLGQAERVNIAPLVEELPYRSYSPYSNRPSDIVNLLFVGSREEISAAFTAAGWSQAQPSTLRSDIRSIRAVAEDRPYRNAPMSSLLINNEAPDMSWEKGLNDASKRHHIRIWKQSELWHGRELWVGAATQDVNFAFFRPGQRMTHSVDWNIDRERNKVADDLVFTGCVDTTDSLARPGVPHSAMNGTGDPLSTDARLAFISLNECAAPRLATESIDDIPLPVHGSGFQRFVRREILSMRSDLIRTNVYYRAYEGTRWIIEAAIRHHRQHDLEKSLAAAAHSGEFGSGQ